MDFSLPWPIKIIGALLAGFVTIVGIVQAIEYCVEKYDKFGPNLFVMAHSSWVESPWKSTLLVAFVVGIVSAILSGAAYFAWNKFGSFAATSEAAKEESPSPAFSVREGWTLAHQPPNLWFVGLGSRTPIHYAILITFTNLRPHPILIEGYTIEQKLKDEAWQSVSLPFGATNGKMYMGTLEKAQETNFVTFEDVIREKNIAPNESIRAWVFLIRPRRGLLRLTIDTPGGSYTQQTQGRGGSSWSVQPMLWAAAPGTAKIDINGMPEDDFSPKTPAPPKVIKPSSTPAAPPKVVNVDEVLALYKGRTAANVTALVALHRGEIVEIEGELSPPLLGTSSLIGIVSNVGNGNADVLCHFAGTSNDALRALNYGDKIKVRGKISGGQNGVTLSLDACELF